MEVPPIKIDIDPGTPRISSLPHGEIVQIRTRIQMAIFIALILAPKWGLQDKAYSSSETFQAAINTLFIFRPAQEATEEELFDEWLAGLGGMDTFSDAPQPLPPEAAPEITYRVKGKLLSVRKKPTKRSPPLFMLEHGMEFTVEETRELPTGIWLGFKLQGTMYWIKQEPEDTDYEEDPEVFEGYKILIELQEHRLTLLKGDGEKWVLEKTYPVGLTKLKEGRYKQKEERDDKRNPIGNYFVAGVKQFPDSGEETKDPDDSKGPRPGLHISYPNKYDAWRGVQKGLVPIRAYETIRAEHRQRRVPDQDTELGSEIMIHDGGAKDNTSGCFSLSRRHMEELLKTIPPGTPVEIR